MHFLHAESRLTEAIIHVIQMENYVVPFFKKNYY